MNFDEYALKKPFAKTMPESWVNLFFDINKSLKFEGIQKPRILDYGCGDGRVFFFLSQNGFDKALLYGCDVSKVRLERCKKLGWKNIKLIGGSKLNYKKDFFHVINMMEVIEHIEGELANALLKSISKILHPNGYFLITTPNYPIKRFYDFWAAIFFGQTQRFLDDPTHYELYSHKKLKEKLQLHFNSVEEKDFKNGFLYKYIRIGFFKHKICYLCRK